MLDLNAKTLAVFSHPNHEMAVYGLLRTLKPAVCFLTDGGGGDRLAQTRLGLDAAGIADATYLDHSEASFYKAVLGRDVKFFQDVAAQVTEIIREKAPEQILVDSVEYYNPIHDIALPIIQAAVKPLGICPRILAVPLVYQGAGTDSFVFQRSLPGDRAIEESFIMSAKEGLIKRAALSDIYTALMGQMKFPFSVIDQACREEHVVPAGSPLTTPDLHCRIRYDERGLAAKKAGLVQEAILYGEHFLPLVKTLLA